MYSSYFHVIFNHISLYNLVDNTFILLSTVDVEDPVTHASTEDDRTGANLPQAATSVSRSRPLVVNGPRPSDDGPILNDVTTHVYIPDLHCQRVHKMCH